MELRFLPHDPARLRRLEKELRRLRRRRLPDKSWKAVERRIAALFGAKRTGAHGDTSFDFVAGGDAVVNGRDLGAEVKHRRGFPRWLLADMAQTLGHLVTVKNPTDPVLILVPNGCRKENALVVLRLEDYQNLRGYAGACERALKEAIREEC